MSGCRVEQISEGTGSRVGDQDRHGPDLLRTGHENCGAIGRRQVGGDGRRGGAERFGGGSDRAGLVLPLAVVDE